MTLENKKITYSLISILIIVIIGWLGYQAIVQKNLFHQNKFSGNHCFTVQHEIVRGHSMEPLIKDGAKITTLMGYYQCNPVKRNDIVLIKYAGRKDPLIKSVKAIPNDKFHLQKTSSGWQVIVNGQVLKNSVNQPYLLNEQRHKMLSLYEKSYHQTIPTNAYLVLGDQTKGSLDSTRFGLISQKSIIGKVAQ